MNPRAAAAWSLGALTIALASGNPMYRVLVLLAALNVVASLRREAVRLRPLLVASAVAGLIAVIITALASHTGVHVLLTVPQQVPVVGGAITLEAVVFGLSTAAGIAATVISASVLSVVVEPHDLVDALPRALTRTGAALSTSLNLIPALARSAGEIREAQLMRGWRPRRVRDWPDIAVPVVLTAVESSMVLAEAMEARGYGAGPRTHFRRAAWRGIDTAVTVCALGVAAAFVSLRITGAVGDWYPFPALTAPPVAIPAVVCCLALIVPALIGRR